MLKKRILTALVLIPLVFAAIYWLSPIYFPVVVGIVVAIAAWEWAGICGFESKSSKFIYIVVIVAIFLICGEVPVEVLIGSVSGVAIGWWLWSIVWLLRYQRQTVQIRRNRFAFAAMGILILIPFWIALVMLHAEQTYQYLLAREANAPYPHILLFVISIVALADTGAYFFGKKWGKHPLASRISPGKTWEGLVGGFITVGFFTPTLSAVMHIDKFDIIKLSILVFITVIAAVLGDLFESFAKRLAGVKDSGTILPGHGGILDRIDSYTAAVPIFMVGYFLL